MHYIEPYQLRRREENQSWSESRIDRSRSDSRIDQSWNDRIDLGGSDGRIDQSWSDSRIDQSLSDGRIDQSGSDRIDLGGSDSSIDQGRSDGRIDQRWSDSRIDRGESDGRIDQSRSDSRIDQSRSDGGITAIFLLGTWPTWNRRLCEISVSTSLTSFSQTEEKGAGIDILSPCPAHFICLFPLASLPPALWWPHYNVWIPNLTPNSCSENLEL